jgi:hypothetical protein
VPGDGGINVIKQTFTYHKGFPGVPVRKAAPGKPLWYVKVCLMTLMPPSPGTRRPLPGCLTSHRSAAAVLLQPAFYRHRARKRRGAQQVMPAAMAERCVFTAVPVRKAAPGKPLWYVKVCLMTLMPPSPLTGTAVKTHRSAAAVLLQPAFYRHRARKRRGAQQDDALAGLSQQAHCATAQSATPGANGHGCGHNLLG